jgi:hypothetical protein
MNRLMSAALSGVLLCGMSVSSHAHWDRTYLPLYGTVEDSIRRAGAVLKAMGGKGQLRQGLLYVEMTWEPPAPTMLDNLSMEPWRKVEIRDAQFSPPGRGPTPQLHHP